MSKSNGRLPHGIGEYGLLDTPGGSASLKSEPPGKWYFPSGPDHKCPLHREGHVMAGSKSTKRALLRAASYVRMSSGKQERSPAQQRGEITKLADREGCRIVARFSDRGITGDSGPQKRPGFRAMLAAGACL